MYNDELENFSHLIHSLSDEASIIEALTNEDYPLIEDIDEREPQEDTPSLEEPWWKINR